MNTPQENAGPSKPSIRSYLTLRMRDYGILLALIVIIAFFQIMTDGVLLRPVNITNLFLQNSYVIIMALGMLMIIVAGHIDLSVGSIVGFIGALAAVMIVQWHLPVLIAAPACIIAGMLIGAWQGYWVAYWRISFLYRDAGGYADLPRPVAVASERPVCWSVPGRLPVAVDRFRAGPVRRRPSQHDGARPPVSLPLPQSSILPLGRVNATRLMASRTSPSPSSSAVI